jgi:Family of unknown function (DUF6527)
MKQNRLQHEFVDFIPDKMRAGILYVSMSYGTVTHLCCCGCANEVVTPLTPSDWTLTFDGETISLAPSIGSWNMPCRSHYWIRENVVCWVKDRWEKPDSFTDSARSQEKETKIEKPRWWSGPLSWLRKLIP